MNVSISILFKYGIHIGCISPFYHHGDVNIETHLVVCLYMNQIAASFRIAGIIIATTTKVHSLASFGEYNAMSPAYCNSTLVSERFGSHAS